MTNKLTMIMFALALAAGLFIVVALGATKTGLPVLVAFLALGMLLGSEMSAKKKTKGSKKSDKMKADQMMDKMTDDKMTSDQMVDKTTDDKMKPDQMMDKTTGDKMKSEKTTDKMGGDKMKNDKLPDEKMKP